MYVVKSKKGSKIVSHEFVRSTENPITPTITPTRMPSYCRLSASPATCDLRLRENPRENRIYSTVYRYRQFTILCVSYDIYVFMLCNKSNLLGLLGSIVPVLGVPGTSTIPNSHDSILVALLLCLSHIAPHCCPFPVASCVIFICL